VASDLYATGVVLYEALAGRRPVDEDVPFAARPTATPTELTDLRPDVPPSLATVVMRAIASDPAERYATAAEMATALRSPSGANSVAVAGRPSATATLVVTATSNPTVRVPPIRWTPAAGEALPSTHRRRDPRPRMVILTIAVAALLVAAIIAVAMAVVDHATSTATSPPTTPATTPATTAVPSASGAVAGSPPTSAPAATDSTTIAAGAKRGHGKGRNAG
jgi:serine/threonine-protein kinase